MGTMEAVEHQDFRTRAAARVAQADQRLLQALEHDPQVLDPVIDGGLRARVGRKRAQRGKAKDKPRGQLVIFPAAKDDASRVP